MYPSSSIFKTISLSEQNHMNSIKNLCLKYKVDISNINESEVGVFVLPELQSLYNTLLTTNQQPLPLLINALRTGKIIEEKDIKDILALKIGMPYDIVKVFKNLRSGSYNHLSAFNSSLL